MKRITFALILSCLSEFSSAQNTFPNPLNFHLTNPMSVISRQIEGDYSKIQLPMVMSQDGSPVLNLKPYTKELERAAKNGDAAAMVEVGKCYLFGNGVDENNKKAQKWFEEAIELNNADALFWMGYMYESGKAKKIRLASTFAKLRMQMNNSLERYSLPREEADAYKKASGEYYQRAAAMDQPDALYKLYCLNKDMTILRMSAEKGNMKAQYECGAYYLNQFKSSHNNTSYLALAKEWFSKAAEQGHPDAAKVVTGIEDAERQIEIANREAQEQARQQAIEAARRDSIARVQAEQQRRQDSIDYVTGVKIRPYRMLISDCNTYIVPPTEYYQVNNLFGSDYYKRLTALSRNDMMAYFGKENLDGLDKELYRQSDQYRTDLAEFNRKKQEKFALLVNIWYSASNVHFDADGFYFSGWDSFEIRQRDMGNYYIDFCRLLFPIQQTRNDKGLKFKTSDIKLLQKIRENNNNLSVLFIFKPSASVEFDTRNNYYFHITTPLAIYLVDNTTGETLMDLSKSIRKTTTQAEKQRITSAVRNYNVKLQRQQQQSNRSNNHHRMVRRTCTACGGSGLHIWPSGNRDRCMGCDGKGYTESYF